MPADIPDIYLMKRQKSRAGCMTVLIVTLIVIAVAGLVILVQWPRARPAPDAESEPVSATEAPAKTEAAAEPTPAPVPAPEAAPEAAAPADPPAADAAAAPGERPADAPAAAVPPPPPATGDAAALLAQAREAVEADNLQAAREAALAALAASPGHPDIEAVLNNLAMPLLASQRTMPEKTEYTVQSGDYLGKIAATYNTPVALIAKANHIQGAIIRIGESLRLLDGNNHTFALEISKSRNDVLVTLDGRFFKRYPAATGRDNKTPIGSFQITDKIAHPPWHKPGGPPIPYGHPDNLLGTHWLAIDRPGYGLHGTWEPDSIGGQNSDGCIRLLNEHIEELYTILPKGTPVTIVD